MLFFVTLAMLTLPNEYFTEMTSPVYEMEGSPADLAKRAETCLSLHAGHNPNGPVILSSNPESGVVVANAALQYRDGLLPWRVRSRLTFEARENRFRLTHTAIERAGVEGSGNAFMQATSWGQVGKWRGSGWMKVQEALNGITSNVANCVRTSVAPSEEW